MFRVRGRLGIIVSVRVLGLGLVVLVGRCSVAIC